MNKAVSRTEILVRKCAEYDEQIGKLERIIERQSLELRRLAAQGVVNTTMPFGASRPTGPKTPKSKSS